MFSSFSPDLDVNPKFVRSNSTVALERLVKLLEKHVCWSLFMVKLPTLVICHWCFPGISLNFLELFHRASPGDRR